jgi:hypothetical protein
MKIQFRNYLDRNYGRTIEDLLTYIVFTNTNDTNSSQICNDHFQQTGELDIEMKINGIEIDVEPFFNEITKDYKEMEELGNTKFERWKSNYISKNSEGAKYAKLKEQFDKVVNILENIKQNLK